MKFVLWGAGKNCTWLVNALGQDFIEKIVDSNEKLVGKNIWGIKIFSKKILSKDFFNFPVIITSTGYKDEIIKEITELGFKTCFSADHVDEYQPLKSISIYLKFVSKKIEKNKIILFYGFTLFSLFSYFYFSTNGYECYFVKENSVENSGYAPQLKLINEVEIKNLEQKIAVLYTSGKNNCDISLNCNVVNLDRIDLLTEVFYNKNLEKFKNVHKDKRCFIIGNGPSLKIEDLETLQAHNEYSFAVNGIIKIFDQTKFRPSYYCMSDANARLNLKDALNNIKKETFFLADMALAYNENEESSEINIIHTILKKDAKDIDFSDDICKGCFVGYTVLYDICLQVAAYMGFKKIYLIGADCTNYGSTEKQHFISSYSDGERSKNYYGIDIDRLENSYKVAKQYADAHGIKIYNATRGGALEVFPRVDFDSLF